MQDDNGPLIVTHSYSPVYHNNNNNSEPCQVNNNSEPWQDAPLDLTMKEEKKLTISAVMSDVSPSSDHQSQMSECTSSLDLTVKKESETESKV